jgi:hypothetical protein
MLYLDYSSYKTFYECTWLWYEKYVNKVMQGRPSGQQRSDALALGSLVHTGLENWYKHGRPEVTPTVIDFINPTPDTFGEATTLLQEYVRRYPEELWTPQVFEKPMALALPPNRRDSRLGMDTKIVAKIDGSFTLEEDITIPGGLDQEGIYLQAGTYGLEHKTKDAEIPKGLYMKAWQTNLQASFQLLVLREHFENVRGVLVNVLEKPRPYIPKRKCKGCSELQELSLYRVGGAGMYICPTCGHEQELSKGSGPRVERQYDCWRFLQERSEDQLSIHYSDITQTSNRMWGIIQSGMTSCVPNREQCVIPVRRRTCEFFEHHLYGIDTAIDQHLVPAEDYVGEGMMGLTEEAE